ncbi:MAG: hypothetical protein IKJ92_07930 [Bacteroidaceae bacterium]|nr:hypothetical protein [Bacteroidaceae bacterium]
MRQVLTLVIKNILVRSPTDVTNKHGWTSAIISAVRHHLRTLCVKGYIERFRLLALSPLALSPSRLSPSRSSPHSTAIEVDCMEYT